MDTALDKLVQDAESRAFLLYLDVKLPIKVQLYRSRQPEISDHIDAEYEPLGLKFRFYRQALPESANRLRAVPSYSDLDGIGEYIQEVAMQGWEALYKASLQRDAYQQAYYSQNDDMIKLVEFVRENYRGDETRGASPIELAIRIMRRERGRFRVRFKTWWYRISSNQMQEPAK